MGKVKSFVAGLLAAVAGLVPGTALAQGGLGEAMRARMQARLGQQERDGRSADNGGWQRTERPRPPERGEWHRADPAARPSADASGDDRARAPDGDRADRNQRRGALERADRPGLDRFDRRDELRPARPVTGGGDRGAWRGRGNRVAGAADRRWDTRDQEAARYRHARDKRAWYDRSDFDDRRDWNWRSDDARAWLRDAAGGATWDRGWRHSGRYDWNGYRASHRSAYRLPRYYAPGGWNGGYRRFPLGARLLPALFAELYWIDDPYAYRLPAAYGPYRWIRYYNDAVLVDVDSGEVVDSVYDLFW